VVRAVHAWRERDAPVRRRGIPIAEEQQLDVRRMLGEHAEVDAAGAPRRAQRSARSGRARARAHRAPRCGAMGLTCQIRRQYSRMARSDEKWPTLAALRIDICVQSLCLVYASLTRS